jgi:hypothetical protein
MSDTSNFDYLGYGKRKRAAGSQYGASAAKSAYSQFLAQQRGNRQVFDINKQFEKAAPRLVSGYTQRGLAGPGVQSGIYNRGLTDFANQKTEDINTSQMGTAGEIQQSKLGDAQSYADYQAQLAQLEFEKNSNIANTAASLTAWKPFLGA